MEPLLFILGLGIVLTTLFDVTSTILAPRGAGFIADRLSRSIWRFMLFIVGRDGRNKLLCSVGPFLLLFIILSWVVLLWTGNTLMVYSDPEALWSPAQNEFASGLMEKMYFVAYVLSSMGNGDYSPSTDGWLFFTGLMSYTGLMFITLSISFLIPVVEAITLKRQVGLRIHSLGKNPREILMRYEANGYEELLAVLADLEPSILRLAQYHLAFPVIHYFHSVHLFECLPVKLVSLDETMSILMYRVPRKKISNVTALERTYGAMTFYLSTLADAFIQPKDDEPEHPDTSFLEEASNGSPSMCLENGDDLKKRRELLLAYLQNDGWEWDTMVIGGDKIELDH